MYRTKQSEERYKKHRSKENGCPFCRIDTDNERIVYQGKDFLVIINTFGYDLWDRRKVSEHLLVIPKKHYIDINEINTKKEIYEYMNLLQKYNSQGYDIFTRSFDSATKSQSHFHTHLIKGGGSLMNNITFTIKPYQLTFK